MDWIYFWSLDGLLKEVLANFGIVVDFIELGDLRLIFGLFKSQWFLHFNMQQNKTHKESNGYDSDNNCRSESRRVSISGLLSGQRLRRGKASIAWESISKQTLTALSWCAASLAVGDVAVNIEVCVYIHPGGRRIKIAVAIGKP